MNTVNLIGRLTKDPELRYSPSGTPICRFTIAVNREFSNQQGEREADFISCIAFNKQAENLSNFQKKGNRVGVVGRIQTGSYEGQDGKRVYTSDVVANNIEYLDYRSEQQNGQNSVPNNQPPHQNVPQPQYGGQNQQYTQQNNGQNAQYGQQFGNSGQFNQQQNYTRVDEDPFANSRSIEVDESDLPF